MIYLFLTKKDHKNYGSAAKKQLFFYIVPQLTNHMLLK
jgi:hypothetical protein